MRALALPVTVLLLLVFYPNYYQDLFNGLGGGTTGQLAPTVPTMVVMCVYVMMALGLNVVVGYAGLLDLGYVAFYAAGAYIAGWFATLQFAPQKIHFLSVGVLPVLPGLHFNVWLLLIVGAIFACVLGIIIGLPTLRLRGDYLAIVTLGFGEIIPQAVNNGDDWLGHNVTNGPNGLTPIDSLGFGVSIHNAASFLPSSYRLEINSADYYYWTGLALVLFTLFCCIRLRDSRLGRAWVAIREDEIAAAAMGVPLMRTKTLAYAIGAFFGGAAGLLLRDLQELDLPAGLLAQHLDRGAVHGDPGRDGERLGGLPRRRGALVPELPGARGGRQQPEQRRRHDLQHPSVHVRHLRRHHRGHDARAARRG